MTKFIVLSYSDVLNLFHNKPVKVYVDHIPHILCTDDYYEDIIKGENTDMMDEQEESHSIQEERLGPRINHGSKF